MGFAPREIDRMSVWEFRACVAGYKAAHGAAEKPEPEFSDGLLAIIDQGRGQLTNG